MKELSIKDVFKSILGHAKLIVLVVFAVVVVTSFYTFKMMPDEYTSDTTLYVLTQQNENVISSSDLSASALLVNDYRELVLSYKVTSAVAQQLGLESLKGYDINVTSLSNTRLIQISVTGREPQMAANIANGLAQVFSQSVTDIMRVDNVSVIDEARVAEKPSGPARERTIVLAAMVTALVMMLIAILKDALNTTLKTAADVEQQVGLSVLAQVARVDGK
ncbi:hypothetical protein H8699_08975 [Christensenellaceae bacterium NSJ-44]|uniref:Polysaccharide chain length determinant N-terminal domain-containing protein n=1 Tax=Luoshenia tenuis TaxID=2763654 RepID=A0A926D1L5_9FIRM|nr:MULTISPECIES: Wzz/FepE/Etk N-terminal domain-containing protein [Clostridia]MBC8529556.1 hypothetical protein [Luoshenia tenuis]SCI75523.1 Capsular polysaccharide type 8 biosynthesis protein cap8A [uncultured Clostridium sp.]